jgi:hypothetical protein
MSCANFQVDLTASFGICTCGKPKSDHKFPSAASFQRSRTSLGVKQRISIFQNTDVGVVGPNEDVKVDKEKADKEKVADKAKQAEKVKEVGDAKKTEDAKKAEKVDTALISLNSSYDNTEQVTPFPCFSLHDSAHQANAAKTRGNTAFTKGISAQNKCKFSMTTIGDFETAVQELTAAIELNPSDHVFYRFILFCERHITRFLSVCSNRSAAYASQNKWKEVSLFCTTNCPSPDLENGYRRYPMQKSVLAFPQVSQK